MACRVRAGPVRLDNLLAMLRARSSSLALAVALVAVGPLLSACTADEPTVALLVADGTDSSSRAVDVDVFTERVEATCDECRVRVYDAEGDADAQKSQARQAEATSADVVVVVPVEPDDLGTLTGSGLPVVSLGELVPGSDRHVGLRGGAVPSQSGSDLEAARDVLLGEEESMTYVPTRAMSERAADVAVAFLADATVDDGEVVDGVESWLYRDREVTVDSLTSVLVAEGVVDLDELCSGSTEKRCARLGLR
jgi:ABC-type xylose transport system substrate-binding protein